MYNALKYENTAVASGTKRGFLKSARRLEKQMLDELKAAWRKLTSTDSENNDVLVLNEGISFEPTQSTATETQLNDLKKTNNELVTISSASTALCLTQALLTWMVFISTASKQRCCL